MKRVCRGGPRQVAAIVGRGGLAVIRGGTERGVAATDEWGGGW